MLSADPAVAPVLPRFAFLLDDVSRLDDRALQARPLTPPTRLTLLLLARAAGHPDLAGDLREWTADLRAVLDRPDGPDMFRAVMTYIQLVADDSTDDLLDVLGSVGPDAEEAYVTIAERLRAEGKAEGKAEALLAAVRCGSRSEFPGCPGGRGRAAGDLDGAGAHRVDARRRPALTGVRSPRGPDPAVPHCPRAPNGRTGPGHPAHRVPTPGHG